MPTKVARHRGESGKRYSKNPAPRCKAERQSLELARERERVSKVERLMLSGLLSGVPSVLCMSKAKAALPSPHFLTSSPSLLCRRRKLFRIFPPRRRELNRAVETSNGKRPVNKESLASVCTVSVKKIIKTPPKKKEGHVNHDS